MHLSSRKMLLLKTKIPKPALSPLVAVRAGLAVGLALCLWMTTRPVCAGCDTEERWVTLDDGTPIFTRLYVPSPHADHLPAVVVRHGYLANLGLMQVPWAADLTRLGIAALFVDGRGHGWSGGTWWPPAHPSHLLADAAPDLTAAIADLRSRAPLVDSSRIALIGHSDGATEALMAASADWDIAATVSFSASAAPWEFVDDVAPANLLLLYGTEDRFVLQHTDELLIRHATLGYLDGEGMVGQLADGSARRLMRVAGRGHVDLPYSDEARRAALQWIAQTFGITTDVVLSPSRVSWAVAGFVLLTATLLCWQGWPWSRGLTLHGSWSTLLRMGVVLGVWCGGLLLAARYAPTLRDRDMVPAQEGAVVVALLSAELLVTAGMLAVLLGIRQISRPPLPRLSTLFSDACWGIMLGIGFDAVFEILLTPVYETPVNVQRVGLFALFFVFAFPAFGVHGLAQHWVAGRSFSVVLLDALLAVLTASVAGLWFVRMSALPVYLLACALPAVGAYRVAGHRGGIVGTATFGAFIYARCLSFVCAFY
jgi:poly(3-hydroxybutyrate) depolymerase